MHLLCQLRICLAELQEMTEQRVIIKIPYQHNIRTTSNYDQKDYKSQQTHIINQQNLHNPYPQLTKRQEENPVKKKTQREGKRSTQPPRFISLFYISVKKEKRGDFKHNLHILHLTSRVAKDHRAGSYYG